MKHFLIAAVMGLSAATGANAAESYVLDSTHSQIIFSYNHLGYSTTTGAFAGFDGEIEYDAEDPAASSVSVSFPVSSLWTGDAGRDEHFLTDEFFGAEANPLASFVSTGIEVTGDSTALITGDLTVNGITKPVTLDTTLNQAGDHPMANKPWMGLTATATVLRSDYDMGMYVPYISDEVEVVISIEAMKAE